MKCFRKIPTGSTLTGASNAGCQKIAIFDQ